MSGKILTLLDTFLDGLCDAIAEKVAEKVKERQLEPKNLCDGHLIPAAEEIQKRLQVYQQRNIEDRLTAKAAEETNFPEKIVHEDGTITGGSEPESAKPDALFEATSKQIEMRATSPAPVKPNPAPKANAYGLRTCDTCHQAKAVRWFAPIYGGRSPTCLACSDNKPIQSKEAFFKKILKIYTKEVSFKLIAAMNLTKLPYAKVYQWLKELQEEGRVHKLSPGSDQLTIWRIVSERKRING